MFRILGDEEIAKRVTDNWIIPFRITRRDKKVAQAQLQFDLKQFVEWGDEPCQHVPREQMSLSRRACPKCWSDLRKQAGL